MGASFSMFEYSFILVNIVVARGQNVSVANLLRLLSP